MHFKAQLLGPLKAEVPVTDQALAAEAGDLRPGLRLKGVPQELDGV